MIQLENYYLNCSYGHYRLWGNGESIKDSTILMAGWGFDPEDENHDYNWESWNVDGSGTYNTKEEFLSYWASCVKRCQES